jgi:hypothetical protein
MARAEQQLLDFVRDLLDEARKSGDVRGDIAAGELAAYCVHALQAAKTLPSRAAVRRLVAVTLAGVEGSRP